MKVFFVSSKWTTAFAYATFITRDGELRVTGEERRGGHENGEREEERKKQRQRQQKRSEEMRGEERNTCTLTHTLSTHINKCNKVTEREGERE